MPQMLTPNTTQNSQPNTPAVINTQAAAGASPPATVWPFDKSGKLHVEQGQTQNIASASWAAGSTQTFQVPTFGYLRYLWLTLTGAAGAKGATAIVAGSPDAPWNLFANILLTDVNGTPLWNLDGYASFLARLLGGYKNWRPDQSTYGYTSIDGTANGGLGSGNFKAKFEIPIEFGTDGLGCLPNMDASAQYRLNLTYNGPATFYNGAAQQPATLPGLAGLMELGARTRPASVDLLGNPQATQPPAAGTVPFWTAQTFNVVNGQNNIQLSRVGNLIRNHIFVFRDANGSRANADSSGVTPTVIEFDWDAGIRYKMNTDTQRQENYELYGFDVPAGVIAFPNTDDPEGLPGHEYGNRWMQTVGSTLLKLQFTSSAAGTLQIITNDIVPASNAVFSAPMMGL
jgi:hypothetical protein